MHWRHEAAPLGRLREARGRAKGEAGLEGKSPDTQAKEQCLPIASFLKVRQRQYWRSVDNEQLRHDSVSPSQQGTEDEKARLSGISNLFNLR